MTAWKTARLAPTTTGGFAQTTDGVSAENASAMMVGNMDRMGKKTAPAPLIRNIWNARIQRRRKPAADKELANVPSVNATLTLKDISAKGRKDSPYRRKTRTLATHSHLASSITTLMKGMQQPS